MNKLEKAAVKVLRPWLDVELTRLQERYDSSGVMMERSSLYGSMLTVRKLIEETEECKCKGCGCSLRGVTHVRFDFCNNCARKV